MKNLTKKIVVLFTAIFLSISLGSVSFADGHGKKILFSIKGPGSGNPFWASVTKGAEEEAKKLGVKLILIAPPQEGDVQAQINLAANAAPFLLFVPIKVTPSLIPFVSTNTTGTPLLIASSTIGAKAFGSPGARAIASTPFAS